MQAFVTVAELHGFAAAARKLGLSAPAVTRLVAALEQQLSLQLLHRTTRSVSLTAAGARFLQRAQTILAAVDDAEREVRSEQSEPAGRFVVAAPAVFGRREVAPLVCDYLARYPAVRVELLLADRNVNLVEDGVDIAVRIGVLADSSLRARNIGSTRRVVIASPAYLATHKRIRTPDDLASHAIIQFTTLTPLHEWVFGDRRIAVAPRLVTNSADAAIELAVRGGGVAMVLAYQVRDALAAGTLVAVLARHEPPPVPIQLVYPETRLPSASLRAFIDLAVSTRDWKF